MLIPEDVSVLEGNLKPDTSFWVLYFKHKLHSPIVMVRHKVWTESKWERQEPNSKEKLKKTFRKSLNLPKEIILKESLSAQKKYKEIKVV